MNSIKLCVNLIQKRIQIFHNLYNLSWQFCGAKSYTRIATKQCFVGSLVYARVMTGILHPLHKL